MDGLPYGDIIVIGAIAAFILLRYRAMLGEKSGRETPPPAPPRPLQEFERVIQLPGREQAATTAGKDYGDATQPLTDMRKVDRQFTPEDFLQGARGAFEMVVEAFNNADRATLTMLLSKDIAQHFFDALDKQNAEGKSQQTTLVAIAAATITAANLTGTKARITVTFNSEQVVLVRNAAGEVVEGNPSNHETVEDHWTFERNLANADPSWKVIET